MISVNCYPCLSGKEKSGNKSSKSSHDSSISTTEIECILDQLRQECHRSSTRKTYYGIWKTFNRFFLQLDRKPNTWEECILLFAGYLVSMKCKSSTVKSYISAIQAMLFNIGREVNKDRLLLGSITRAARINYD